MANGAWWNQKPPLALTVVIISVMAVSVLLHGNWDATTHLHEEPSAVIVDQLSLTIPNATFISTATSLLQDAGYIVDYYSSEEATVGLYQRLPSLGYDIIVLRTHSAASNVDGSITDVAIFTGEDYAPRKYVWERYRGHVTGASDDAGNKYFALRPTLLDEARGDFEGALVVMMGCQGIINPSLANTFINNGAGAYVGWTTLVTADRTDTATITFLSNHLTGSSVANSIHTTNKIIGEDLDYGSKLNAIGKVDAMQ